ncbi:MAG: hypothetical protein ACLT3Y_00065 [Ruminococcus callidus]
MSFIPMPWNGEPFSRRKIYYGEGINVSVILKELESHPVRLALWLALPGQPSKRRTGDGNCHNFVHLESGFSRINVKIKSGEETELNGQDRDR